MRHRINYYYLAIAFLLLIFNISCKNKEAKEVFAFYGSLNTESTRANTDSLITLEYLKNFKTEQLGERKFVLQPGDTIQFDKPFLKLFTGQIDGKDAQLWLSKNMSIGEEFSFDVYDAVGTLYIEGDDIRYCYFADKKGQIYIDEERTYIFSRLIYDEILNTISIEINTNLFTLQESNLRFHAYDSFRYENTLCQMEGISPYLKSHWRYDSFFGLDSVSLNREQSLSNQRFIKLFGSDLLKKQISSYDIGRDVLILDTDNPDEDLCSRVYTQSIVKPLYLDSLIYITIDLGYVDLGGAHGMFITEYKNYDMKTGKEMKVEDVLDMSSSIFTDYNYNKIKNDLYNSENSNFLEVQVSEPSSFYILPSGIGLHYPGYSLGGGFWEKEVFLPYNEIKAFLKTDKYFRK